MPHILPQRNLSHIAIHEISQAKAFLKYGEIARDENGLPFLMTQDKAKRILRQYKGIFWRLFI